MSFLGGFLESGDSGEKYVDDQTAQENRRDNRYVGHVIDMACTVYDTMLDGLRFALRGRANVVEKMDGVVSALEERCRKITEKYRDILSKLGDVGADLSAGLSFDLVKEAFDLLNSYPILRRYVGEANYWVLWDMLAVMSGQGMSVGADISANIKDAIKGTIYALLSMTNGLMHFESYISQITSFWGYLYVKEIWLPLTDSICPQVTCQYYYRHPHVDNPVPGPAAYAPMPFPVFDLVNNSAQKIASHFSYDDPDTWDVLTPQSRAAFRKAYNYWKSDYTNATSVNSLLSDASRKLTGGAFTAGFGSRTKYGDGAPLQVGSTFAQLDTSHDVGFPVKLIPDALADAFAAVDTAFATAISALRTPGATEARDSRIEAAGYSEHTGSWIWVLGSGAAHADDGESAALDACVAAALSIPEFAAYVDSIAELSHVFHELRGTPYVAGLSGERTPLSEYLLDFYTRLEGDSELPGLSEFLRIAGDDVFAHTPYSVYMETPDSYLVYCLLARHMAMAEESTTPFYTAASAFLSYMVDADDELGRQVDGGREPLFAAIGVYGDLKGLYPWKYEVVPLDSFRESYTCIRRSYHIYYRNDDPAELIFADRIIQVGTLKYIATHRPVASDTITRGDETYTAYIFPSETCSVHPVPAPGMMFGVEFPNFASVQHVDAVGPNGTRYMYDLTRNAIPRYPKYVDADRWSVMDLIHELWLLADALEPLCGDGGRRRDELNELLNGLGLSVRGEDGPRFIGQLPVASGQGEPSGEGVHVEMRFDAMETFATRIRAAIDSVYNVRSEVLAATQAW